MTQTLPQVAHEHHERILRRVDQLPAIADGLLTSKAGDIPQGLHETSTFLTGTLIPHVDAAERTLYPEMERMLQNRHSMTPMRREHAEVRRLVAEFTKLAAQVESGGAGIGRRLALRRVLFQLYAVVKVHLAEEDEYLRIVEHGVATDVAERLAAALDHPMTASS